GHTAARHREGRRPAARGFDVGPEAPSLGSGRVILYRDAGQGGGGRPGAGVVHEGEDAPALEGGLVPGHGAEAERGEKACGADRQGGRARAGGGHVVVQAAPGLGGDVAVEEVHVAGFEGRGGRPGTAGGHQAVDTAAVLGGVVL